MAIEFLYPDDEVFFEHDGNIELIHAQIGYDSDFPDNDVPIRLVYRYEGERKRFSRTIWLTDSQVTDLGTKLAYRDHESSQ